MKKQNDIKIMKSTIEKQLNQTYKWPWYKKLYDLIEGLIVFLCIIAALFCVLFVIITLIENPISLTILCATILLIIVYIKK